MRESFFLSFLSAGFCRSRDASLGSSKCAATSVMPTGRSASGRHRTLAQHTHYVSAHEVWPGDVEVEVENDALRAVRFEGKRYGANRAHVFRWDPECGSWTGQGARRRAWRPYTKSLVVNVPNFDALSPGERSWGLASYLDS